MTVDGTVFGAVAKGERGNMPWCLTCEVVDILGSHHLPGSTVDDLLSLVSQRFQILRHLTTRLTEKSLHLLEVG